MRLKGTVIDNDSKTSGINQDEWSARQNELPRRQGAGLALLALCPSNEVLSSAGLAPRQTLPTRPSFPDAQAVLRGLVSLASCCLWGWLAVSSRVCSCPHGDPSQPATPPPGRVPPRRAFLWHWAIVGHFLASCDGNKFQESSSAGPQRGHLVPLQTLLT